MKDILTDNSRLDLPMTSQALTDTVADSAAFLSDLMETLRKHPPQLKLHVSLPAPRIILPAVPSGDDDSPVVFLNLGQFDVSTAYIVEGPDVQYEEQTLKVAVMSRLSSLM